MSQYIYKITDTRNDMCYIGQSNGNKSYYSGGKIINSILKKYGRKEAKKFLKKEIIVKGDFNAEFLNELEIHYIRLHNTISPYGYNLIEGGKFNGRPAGFKHTEEFKLHLSKIFKGRKLSEDQLKQMSESHSKYWADPEWHLKQSNLIREACKKPSRSLKLSKAGRGRKMSLETRDKVSVAWFKKGCVGMMTGKQHSEDTKDKMKKSWSENKEHRLSRIVIPKPRPKKTNQHTLDGVFIKQWDSISQAAETLSINGPSIGRVMNGSLKTAGGFVWRKVEVNAQ